MHIAVIPARKGSKRLRDKNRQKIDGLELWQWVVYKAMSVFDKVYLNTDYANLVPKCNIYIRPPQLTDGMSYTIDDVIKEMVLSLELDGNDCVHLLQCTNPFISIETLTVGKEILSSNRMYNSAQAVFEIGNIYHEYSQREINSGMVQFCHPADRNRCFNSQKKPKRYAFGGYVGTRVDSLLNGGLFTGPSYPITINRYEAWDIDTIEDLRIARIIAKTKI